MVEAKAAERGGAGLNPADGRGFFALSHYIEESGKPARVIVVLLLRLLRVLALMS